MKIIITDKVSPHIEKLPELKTLGEVKMYQEIISDESELLKRYQDAEIIVTNFTSLTENVINRYKKLQYIIALSKGYNQVAVAAASARGIKVLNCPTYSSQAVAEHALALIFALNRRLLEAYNSVMKNNWLPVEFKGNELFEKLLVTIGYGNIGQKVIRMAQGLGMRTEYANSKTSQKDLDVLIKKADYLVLCLPLDKMTENLIDRRRINLMKPEAYLINVARGLIVDYDSLYAALKNKQIAGAGLDIFPHSPTSDRPTPEITRFFKLINVVATPHIAWNTRESVVKLGEEVIANIKSCLAGKPVNVVN